MFPIALSMASDLGTSFMPFAIVIMLGASYSFIGPTGYQTNLMVYGPGGYKFTDPDVILILGRNRIFDYQLAKILSNEVDQDGAIFALSGTPIFGGRFFYLKVLIWSITDGI